MKGAPGIRDKDSLILLEAFLSQFGIAHHQISSFNDFFEREIKNLEDVLIDPVALTVSGGGKVLHFRFGQVTYKLPMLVDDDGRSSPMYPNLARQRGETYGAALHVDVHVFCADNDKIVLTPNIAQSGLDRRKQRPAISDATDRTDGEDDDGIEEVELAPGITHRVQPRVDLTILPVMIGSRLCRLQGLPNERLVELKESLYEPGGHFLLKGKERVIIPQKNLGKNTLFITQEGDEVTGTLHACVEAVDAPRVVNKIVIGYDKEIYDDIVRVQVNQIYTNKGVPIGIMLALLGMTEWNLVVRTIADYARTDVSIIAKLLRACEAEANKELQDVEARNQFDAAWMWLTEKVSAKQRTRSTDPLPQYPPETKRNAAQEVIHHHVLPHVMDGLPKMQSAEDFWAVCRVKALTLCHLVSQTIRVFLGLDSPTDRDRMEHKRYETPGALMNKLFRSLLRPQLSDFRTQISNMDKNNKPIDIVGAMCSERLQKGLASALQSGKFQLSKRGGRQTGTATAGVSQAVSGINPLNVISHLRKTATQGTRKIPAGARQLHTTQWGYQCPAETPEGQPCGIVNHLAMLGYCSAEYKASVVFDWIRENLPTAVPIYKQAFNPSDWCIVVNGRISFSFKGSDQDTLDWINLFKESRYTEELPRDISISLNPSGIREVRINCDGGRLIRPMCIVKDSKLLITADDIAVLKTKGKGVANPSLDELFRKGKLEFVDGAESEDMFCATMFSEVNSDNPDFTHCEVCPLSILGIAAGISPFAECNQSPRNVYQAGMAKQAMGTPNFPLHGNLRTTNHVLENTEHPIVSTLLQRIDELPLKWLPTGQNCIVCVKAEADNVEDSIIMNESFVQAGGLSSFSDRSYLQTAQKIHHHTNMDSEVFERPNPENTAQFKTEARYDKIDVDGLPLPGETITSETVIIGKTGPLPTPPPDPTARNRSVDRTQMQTDPNHTRRDLSTLPRKNGGGVIQSVVLSHTRDTKRVAVTIRSYRKPQIGDKFCSRHGQKGTVSRIAPADDLPRALDGTIPDIVMNPHAFPSRMTAGQIHESALGMCAAITGIRRDATTFFGPKKDEISDELYMLKLERNCEKRVIDPKTGELMDGALFIGVVYKKTLKHVVEEKIHARQRGPVTRSNRQPVEGRRRDGGLRFGEMEKDATVAHGAAQITRERLCDVSDPFPMPICQTCGRFAQREPTNHESYICKNCDSRDNIAKEIVTYPSKQLVHYLKIMGIQMSFMYDTDRSSEKLKHHQGGDQKDVED